MGKLSAVSCQLSAIKKGTGNREQGIGNMASKLSQLLHGVLYQHMRYANATRTASNYQLSAKDI
ncbi:MULTISPECIES: hypothetical protein [unclassified Moorena]|uniref:hypothetical protein n=1 Tax=unclassified Moorena TaxID=2683338 RepID=UPI0013FE88D3|nr:MULTISPECIES: hypothetical protein [unclassified Moorena]NEO11595.1 hypothetical protein [Moorena sp. SIO3E8]NEP99726.1 hypothetical protein [Moorena sp. SIO3F7]